MVFKIVELDIPHLRLYNQRINFQSFNEPAESVAWMGAVQAQDYAGSLWAVGLRTTGAGVKVIEQALEDRKFLRTWLVRGTLHLVSADDVGWMLDLLREHNIKRTKPRFKQLGLDEEVIVKSREVVTRVLEGGNRMAREEVFQALESESIETRAQRGIHILWRLAQEGLICFGPRQGSRYTFVLLDEWAPVTGKPFSRENGLRELALRFINSHGPATRQDFAWWSGLTSKDAAAGLELAGSFLTRKEFNGQIYWNTAERKILDSGNDQVYLLPAFDEYLMGYKDRSDVLAAQYARKLNDGGGIIKPTILVDATIRGTWKKKILKGTTVIIPEWFDTAGRSNDKVLASAVKRYGEFLSLPVTVARDGDMPGDNLMKETK